MLLYYHLITHPETHKHYSVVHLKELTRIPMTYNSNSFPTRLMRASFNGNFKAVCNLIEQGENKYLNLHGLSSIHWALLSDSKEVLGYLLANEDLKNRNWIWFKSLWNWAIRNCKVSTLEYLLEKLRVNLPLYEFHQITTHEINLVQNSEWEKPIHCFDEEKFIFLINQSIPLQKFNFTSFASSESEAIRKLFSLKNNIELLNGNFNKLKQSKGIISIEDIIRACKMTEKKIKKKQVSAIPLKASINLATPQISAATIPQIPQKAQNNNSKFKISRDKNKYISNNCNPNFWYGIAILSVISIVIISEYLNAKDSSNQLQVKF